MENRLVNIVELFVAAARKYPGHIAIVDKNAQEIRYAEMLEAVQNKAAEMQAKGLNKGDRVLVFVPIGIDLYINVLATLYMGASVVFIDEWTDLSRLRTCCRMAGCRAIVMPNRLRWLKFILGPLRSILLRLDSAPKPGFPGSGIEPVHVEEHTAIITFSSGTTGTPKAADRTHRLLWEQFKALETVRKARPDEVNLTTLPIVLLLNLASGCTSVIADYKPRKPLSFRADKIGAQMTRYGIRSLTLSPYFALTLAEKGKQEAIDRLVVGGACMFPKEVKKLREGFPNAEILLVYGSTEAEPIATCSAEEFLAKHAHPQPGLYVGRAVKETEVLVYPTHQTTGELCVDGPHVLNRYFNSPPQNNRVESNGRSWLKTGDAVHLEADGSLFLLGRQSHIMAHPSQKIYPAVLEMLAGETTGVRFAALKINSLGALLYVEADASFKAHLLRSLLDDQGFQEVEIKQVKFIPRDKRHYSRPDYEGLP